MLEQVLNYFIDQLASQEPSVELLRPELLAHLLPLVHPEPRQDRRQLALVGDIPGNLYLKLSGFAKGYTLKANLNETAPLLWLGPAILVEWRAFIKKKPAKYEISVEQHTPVFTLRRADILDLSSRLKPVKTALHRLMKAQNNYLDAYFRNRNQFDAKERYLHMVEDFGEQLHRIHKKNQAAYLDITPEYLSRILSELNSGGKPPLLSKLGMMLAF